MKPLTPIARSYAASLALKVITGELSPDQSAKALKDYLEPGCEPSRGGMCKTHGCAITECHH